MNINYQTGDVIRNASDFSNYVVPKIRPTEEWAGNEIRSYQNYIRPVANLFENDREITDFLRDFYKSINSRTDEKAVVEGCDVVKTGTTYYEVQHGIFIKSGILYHIYPACEAVAQQIEKEYTASGNINELRLKINYADGKYTYSYQGQNSPSSEFNTAAAVISDILSTLSISTTTYPVENHILLPIFNIADNVTRNIVFDGTVAVKESAGTNDVKFAIITNGSINNNVKTYTTTSGARIQNATITNNSIATPWVKIGTTQLGLGASSANFAGVSTINGVSITSSSGLNITSSSGAVRTTADYTLGDACTKYYSSNTSLVDGDKLPTSSATKTYVDNQIQSAPRAGTTSFEKISVSSKASFADNVNLGLNAKFIVENSENASRAASSVSGAASIYTKGGIEAERDIYANGNIVGQNNGTYSLRSLKENITPFRKSAVKLINDVKIVNYNYISDEEKNHKVGFIADDTDELFSTKNHNIMDQSNCIGILLKAVQELSAEVKKLKEELNDIKLDKREE